MAGLLDKINYSRDLHLLEPEELGELAEDIREYITECVSVTGGHLASNLGTVEATLAMHYVFDFEKDRLFWDVGHQCYTHKILTGRKEGLRKLRQRGGVTGFPSPAESGTDQFMVGHAGTAIATAVGAALAAQIQKSDERIVSVVGDASIVNGLSFEALNNMSLVKRQMLVVLNDNSMAIDVTQGSMAEFLSKVRLSHTYEDMRKTANSILDHIPLIGKPVEEVVEKFKKTLRMAFSASQLFESLNIAYFGPVDGHDVGSMIKLFRALSEIEHPCILHVYTRKGKGYEPADTDPTRFHSTGPFEINGEASDVKPAGRTYTQAFGDAVVKLAREDEKVVAITAAMPDGTGLGGFRNEFAERYFDVGIAESSAAAMAGGMAKSGLKPLVCIYSTFLQRAYDQMFQEASLQNLPVTFCVDRAGVVGADGPTHHGLLDIGFARSLPNMIVMAPACEAEINSMLRLAVNCGCPSAIRYPKASLDAELEGNEILQRPVERGKCVKLTEKGADIVLAACGAVLSEAVRAGDILAGEGIAVDVVNARFVKPLDDEIIEMAMAGRKIVTIEDHSLACGFGSAVLEEYAKRLEGRKEGETESVSGGVVCLGGPDEFVGVGTRRMQLEDIGIDSDSIAECVRRILAGKGTAALKTENTIFD